nr:hypothetical protein BaRGS_024406 [Batillaria attramentaria]
MERNASGPMDHSLSFANPSQHHYNYSSDVLYNASDYDYLSSVDMEPEADSSGPYFLHPMWQAMEPLEWKLSAAIGVIMSLVGVTGAIGNFTVIFLLLRSVVVARVF